MANWASWRTTVIIACATVLSVGCTTMKVPEPRALSEQESTELWSRALSYDRIGAADVRKIQGENEVTVVCTQAYSLRAAGGGHLGTAVTVCGGSCQLKPGSTFGSCVTSGCVPSGRSCSPLVCSGGCTVASSCKAEATVGFFAQ